MNWYVLLEVQKGFVVGVSGVTANTSGGYFRSGSLLGTRRLAGLMVRIQAT
jgi:hypothetical protein